MKSRWKLLLALFLVLGLLPAPIANAAPDTITVHACVPAEWTDPYVYSWPTDGNGATEWPGIQMTQESGQWYVATIPASDENLIINYNGYPQTGDLAFESGYDELWVVIDDYYGDIATIYYSADDVQYPGSTPEAPKDESNPADPEGLFQIPDTLAIVGSGIPGVSEWDPADPAGDMTEITYLCYQIDIPCPAGTSMTFKFAGNDAWDDTCNLGSASGSFGEALDMVNSGESADIGLSVSEGVILRFTVDLLPLAAGAGAATLTVVEVGPLEETPETVTVHARIPESWGNSPCLWAWRFSDNANAFDAWPGETMVQNGQWFEFEVPVWCDGLIVNDGGSIQTLDLTVTAGKEVWLDVYDYDNVDITYSDPGPRKEPVTYITVHARIPDTWDTPPYLWAWNQEEFAYAFDRWPGEAMIRNGEWYEIQIPDWCDGVIVSDGFRQTMDLTVTPGMEVWLDVYHSSDVTITYSDPGPRIEPTEPEPTEPEPTEPDPTDPAPTENSPTETIPSTTIDRKAKNNAPTPSFLSGGVTSILILCGIVLGILGTGTAVYLIFRKK